MHVCGFEIADFELEAGQQQVRIDRLVIEIERIVGPFACLILEAPD